MHLQAKGGWHYYRTIHAHARRKIVNSGGGWRHWHIHYSGILLLEMVSSVQEYIYLYISDGSIIDINASTIQLGVQCRDLLAMHALSGSDTSGKGKMTALKILPNVELQCIANLESSSEEIVDADQKKISSLWNKNKINNGWTSLQNILLQEGHTQDEITTTNIWATLATHPSCTSAGHFVEIGWTEWSTWHRHLCLWLG